MSNIRSEMRATLSALTVLLLFQAVAAADTLFPGQSLKGNQTLTSKSGSFVLGFFQPGKSPRFYIGIWYNIPQQTVVWVANREAPVLSPWSSELKVDRDGNLALISASKIVWSSNSTAGNPNSAFVVLEDSGNLVLKQGPSSQAVIWQSFDHLTNTWLPGALIGRNKITGEIRKLVSWKSAEDPAPGPFSLSIDPKGSTQYVLRWNDSINYWESGRWNGQYFEGMPEMDPGVYNQLPETIRTYMFPFRYIDNDQWRAFYFFNNVSRPFILHPVVDSSGQVQQWNWMENSKWVLLWSQPRRQCDVYALCGPFGVCGEKALPHCQCLTGFERTSVSYWSKDDQTAGCSRRLKLQCENVPSGGRQDKFKPLSNMRLPVNPQILKVKSAEECQSICAKNCSCTAFAYDNLECSVWIGDLLNLHNVVDGEGISRTLYLRVAADEITEKNQKKKRKEVIGVVAAAFVGILLVLGSWWLCRRKGMAKMEVKGVSDGSVIVFPYEYLQSATKNFSEKVGSGGFGTVFKGVLPDFTPIAVKKLEDIHHGEKQFRAEVSTLATVQHVNLIRFHGFCSEGLHRMLVYDFMPNGSLSSHLFYNRNSKILDWKTRYKIIVGVARGLAYLHDQCRECIVHCDIKPENILLDMEFCPKVADFGLAKLIGRDFSRALTTMRGTIGYLAPEWISGLPITPKADVYSYGMMLFEVLSSKRNTEPGDESMFFYPAWAARKVTEHQLLQLVDPNLGEDVNIEELKRASRVACWCIQEGESNRPSMGTIVQILEGVLDVDMPPIPRLLQHLSEDQKTLFFSQISFNR